MSFSLEDGTSVSLYYILYYITLYYIISYYREGGVIIYVGSSLCCIFSWSEEAINVNPF